MSWRRSQTAAATLASPLIQRVAAPEPLLIPTPADITEVREFAAELHVMRTAFERELLEPDKARPMGLIGDAMRTERRERQGTRYRSRARACRKSVRCHDQL